MRFQEIRVCLKELSNESFEGNKIYVGVGVEEFKVDLNAALLDKFQRTISKMKRKPATVSDSLSPSTSSWCPCFRFGIVDRGYGERAAAESRSASICRI